MVGGWRTRMKLVISVTVPFAVYQEVDRRITLLNEVVGLRFAAIKS